MVRTAFLPGHPGLDGLASGVTNGIAAGRAAAFCREIMSMVGLSATMLSYFGLQPLICSHRLNKSQNDNVPLPTLLSSNRQVERQRELAKAGIERKREFVKCWFDKQKRINGALGSSSVAKARIHTANERLATHGGSSTSINSTSIASILDPVWRANLANRP